MTSSPELSPLNTPLKKLQIWIFLQFTSQTTNLFPQYDRQNVSKKYLCCTVHTLVPLANQSLKNVHTTLEQTLARMYKTQGKIEQHS